MTIQHVLNLHRVSYRTSLSDANEISINCPFCLQNRGKVDTQYCLHINLKSRAGHCWHSSCGYKSKNAVRGLLKALNVAPEHVSGVLPPEQQQPQEHLVHLPSDFHPLTEPRDEEDQNALQYILNRGITAEQVERLNLGVSYVGRYAYRVVFPAYASKRLKMIIGRDFTGRREPKYLNSQGEKCLYKFNPKAENLILSEGVFKALRIQQVVGKSACSSATLSTALTPFQIQQITGSSVKQILVYPDPDRAGCSGAVKLADKLSEAWNGELRIVWPVVEYADNAALESISSTLASTQKYGWGIRQKLALYLR